MPTRVTLPDDLAARLDAYAGPFGLRCHEIVGLVMEAVLPMLTGQRDQPAWPLAFFPRDNVEADLGPVLGDWPRWRGEAEAEPEATSQPLPVSLVREDGVRVTVSLCPRSLRQHLHATLDQRSCETWLQLPPHGAWVDQTANGWSKLMRAADCLADELAGTAGPSATGGADEPGTAP